MKTLIRALHGLFAIYLLAGLQNAFAAPLNLVAYYPDFQLSTTTTASYDSTSGELVLSGAATGVSFNSVDPNDPIFGSTFELTANFSTIDGSFLSGSFFITGDVRDFDDLPTILYSSSTDPDGWLLQGTLNDFGISTISGDNDALFEFTFNQADGIFGDLWGPGGGAILRINSGTAFSGGTNTLENEFYAQNWSGTLTSGDVFLPVPAAVWLFLSGIVGLVGVARRKNPV